MHRTDVARVLGLLFCAALLPACGGGGGGGGIVPVEPLSLLLTGGLSTGVGSGNGGRGGVVQVYSAGDITAGSSALPAAPVLPTPPAAGLEVTALAGSIIQVGDVVLRGTVTSNTLMGSYSITSTNGSILVSGTLNAGDPGAGKPVDLNLSAPNGTVYVTGTINTFNTDGVASGDVGGNVNISAARIVFTGRIDTHGEDNAGGNGGNGGIVQMDTDLVAAGTSVQLSGGSIVTNAGRSSGPGPTATGGNAGPLLLTANTTLEMHGTSVVSNGGDAESTGNQPTGGLGGTVTLSGQTGASILASFQVRGGTGSALAPADGARGGVGGTVTVNYSMGVSTGPVRFFGSMDGRGGNANGPQNVVQPSQAAIAGRLFIGDASNQSTASVELGLGSWSLNGGNSHDRGGQGGSLTLGNFAGPGNIVLSSPLDLTAGDGALSHSGGDASLSTTQGNVEILAAIDCSSGLGTGTGPIPSGSGGQINIQSGDTTPGSTGSVLIRAPLRSNGGTVSGSGTLGVGHGGTVELIAASPTGTVTIFPTASIEADGGNSKGATNAGSGGRILMESRDGAVLIDGPIRASGGRAESTGIGGVGGQLIVRSDRNNDDVAGSITIGAGVVVELCGGDGGTGGAAINSGAAFPTEATVALCLNADGDTATTGDDVGEGMIVNNGFLRMDGGASTTAVPGGRGGYFLLSGSGTGPGGSVVAGNNSVLGGAGTPPGQDGFGQAF